MFGWVTNAGSTLDAGGAITRVLGDIILESHLFPTNDTNVLSVSFRIGGNGTARVVIVGWDLTYEEPLYLDMATAASTFVGGALLAEETFELAGDTASTLVTMNMPIPSDVIECQFRLEVEDTTEVYIDQVLVDPNPSSFDYFDGDTPGTYLYDPTAAVDDAPTPAQATLTDDFIWHGDQVSMQMSMWYNNRQAAQVRLFGNDPNYQDDTLVYEGDANLGELSKWIPSEAEVQAHFEAIGLLEPPSWRGAFYYPIKDVTAVNTRP